MRKLMLLVASMLVSVALLASPAAADDLDLDGFEDEFEIEVTYVCEVEGIDWDGDGFDDEFVVELDCELEDDGWDD